MAAVARAHSLTKTYGGTAVVAGMSFHVDPREIVVIVGPNGSGKTTSMEMLLGLRRATSGTAEIAGHVVRPGGSHRRLVGAQLQQSGLPHRIRAGEALQAMASLYNDPEDARDLLAQVGLADAWRTKVDQLSGGQQRRLDVALACIGRPRLLVLDEPTSGLDPEARSELWNLLRSIAQRGCGILTSTHDLGEAEVFADRLLVVRAGRTVLDGTVPEILADAGGEWRIRVPNAPESARQAMRRAGLPTAESGATVVCVGDRREVESLRDTVTLAASSIASEILVGPIRLEDLFLFAGRDADAA